MKNYILRDGDIIRVAKDSAINGQIYFVTEKTVDGKFIAHPFNGPALDKHPLDTIEFIKANGIWWLVESTNCGIDTIKKYNNVTYDLDEALPCIVAILEREYNSLQV